MPITKQLTRQILQLIFRENQHGLLLLSAPTWLWGRCGRHNYHPASSVMDLVFRRSDGSHVSFDTVHPSLLRSSSLSSPGWYHLQSVSFDVVLVSPLYVAKPHVSRFPAPLCDHLYLPYLLGVFVSHNMDDACALWQNHDISEYVLWHASSTDVHVCLL